MNINVHGHVLLVYENSIKLEIENLCNSRENEFPGPQPISIERKYLNNLRNNYRVGIKNDGERFLLCFVKQNGQYISCIVNRKLETFLLNIQATKHLFEGTICDCELVNNNLYIFDCLVICGINISKKPFTQRLNEADVIISSIKTIKHNITIQKKDFKLLENIKELEDTQESDGYIFMPNDAPIVFGTHNTMYKWKPLYRNTIDFALMGNKVYVQNGGKLTWIKVKVKSDNIEIPNDTFVIVECEYVSEKSWKALHVRNDKELPNSSYTYKRTLINIQENIQQTEFIMLLT
jgi:hypothetical protein